MAILLEPATPETEDGCRPAPPFQRAPVSPMKTLLSQFCESFDAIVRPLLEPLDGASRALLEGSPELPGREIRAELLEVRHQTDVLVQKVAEQQAYVLIFGPLKSGKSTLMNALASTYVSEVSSLPAYPCMVYLSHAEERQFDVTRYNGQKERFTDPSALYTHIGRAHGELAERIRSAEERGETFEPAEHFPAAIRKVDVRIPAGDLDESGAVLVDTPGLYSRMKFGYDQMTREFRDAASCAVFIVKSDNLFLEQVFEEFEELLGLFNRIFLVVNLDTSKRDLSPSGTLIPSLEQEDPLRIIEAFENLAMSAPLKEALDDGRLQIYPVDLLQAASARLQAGNSSGPGRSAPRGEANFDAFLGDLTGYLNSTDYLVAFLGDSLRRAESLMADTMRLLDHSSVTELRVRVEELESDRQDTQHRRHAAQRLLDYDWRAAFSGLESKLAPAIRARTEQICADAERRLDRAVDAWFSNDSSLQALMDEQLLPTMRSFQVEVGLFIRKALDEEVLSGSAGILLPSDVSADMYATEVDLSSIGQEALGRIGTTTQHRDIPSPLHSSMLPVRRTFWDWCLFRSLDKIRGRLLGEANHPALRIPVEIKARRLGNEARDVIRRELDTFKSRFLPETILAIHSQVIGQYGLAAAGGLGTALRERDGVLETHINDVVAQLMEHRKVLAHIMSLWTRTESARAALHGLTAEYGNTEPMRLIEPAMATKPMRPAPIHSGPLGTQPLTDIDSTPPPMKRPMEHTRSSEDRASNAPLSSDELD